MNAAKRIFPVAGPNAGHSVGPNAGPNAGPGTPGRQSGVTLVEAMVAILVLSLLLGLGVPGFVTMFKNNRMVSMANELVADINLARSEAIKRNGQVGLCASSTGAACLTGASSKQWEGGWTVFYDGDKSGDLGTQDCSSAVLDCRLAGNKGLDTGMTLRSSFADALIYKSSGSADQPSGTFGLCDDRGAASGRTVLVSRSGRPRVTSPSANCTP